MVTFDKRLEESKEKGHANITGRSFPGRRKSKTMLGVRGTMRRSEVTGVSLESDGRRVKGGNRSWAVKSF